MPFVAFLLLIGLVGVASDPSSLQADTESGANAINIVIIAASACGYVLLLLLAWFQLKYYKDTREGNAIFHLVATLAIATPIFCLLLVPLDVYVVSFFSDAKGIQQNPETVKSLGHALKAIYYACFGLEMFLFFLALPLSFFYNEDLSEEMSVKDRLKTAVRPTLLFVVLYGVLAMLGSLLIVDESKSFVSWRRFASKDFSVGDSYVSFVMGIVAILGALGFAVYMAFGLAEFPFMLLRQRGGEFEARTIEFDDTNLDREIRENTKEQDYLRSRYDLPNRKWPKADRKAYKTLMEEEKRLRELKENLARPRDGEYSADNFDTLWNGIFWFRACIAFIVVVASLGMWTSVLISVIDKFHNSKCGWSCGFILESGHIPYNPLDQALVAVTDEFPLDFALFVIFLVFLDFALMLGINTVNGYLLWCKFNTVEKERGMIHTLMMLSWQIMGVFVTMLLLLDHLVPAYFMFGNQMYLDSKGQATACTVLQLGSAMTPRSSCIPTQMGRFVLSLSSHYPFFAVIVCLCSVVFLAVYLGATAWGIKRNGRQLRPNIKQGAFLFEPDASASYDFMP